MNAANLALPDADPAELRAILGDNLRILMGSRPNASLDCRKMGINRTQFNRYLHGESFPRPDVLAKICAYYETDANILLWPIGEAVPGEPAERTYLRDRFRDRTLNLTTSFETLRSFVRLFRGEATAFAAIQEIVVEKPEWLSPDERNEIELAASWGPRLTFPNHGDTQ